MCRCARGGRAGRRAASRRPSAYRRDRRKDQLLQENGYFVLRFLAEDVGKELDMVLDAILRALSHRPPSVSPASSRFARSEANVTEIWGTDEHTR